MLIIIHILLAVSALTLSVVAHFIPTSEKLKVSYSLATGTLVSGVLLILVNNASVIRTCLTGITFFAIVSVLNELTRKKLATQPNN